MPELVRAPFQPVELPVELNEANLLGAVVYGLDDYEIGKIINLHDLGYEVEVNVECGDLFGWDTNTIVLPASEMDFMRDDKGNVFATIERTKEEIKSLSSVFSR